MFRFLSFCTLLLISSFTLAQKPKTGPANTAPALPKTRVVVKETKSLNLEIPKPDNIALRQSKVFFSIIELYYENEGKNPQEMRVSFADKAVVGALVSAEADDLVYSNKRSDADDTYEFTRITEPEPGKYTFSLYTSLPMTNLKTLVRVLADGKPLRIVYQFAEKR